MIEILEEQIRTFHPKVVALSCADAAKRLRARLSATQIEVLEGETGLCDVARFPDCDLVISAIVGGAGLQPTLSAIQAGRQVALSQQRTNGHGWAADAARSTKHGVTIFPIDSEHSAIFPIHGRSSKS